MDRSILSFWGLANELSRIPGGDFGVGSPYFWSSHMTSLLGFTSSTAPSCISHIWVGCHDAVFAKDDFGAWSNGCNVFQATLDWSKVGCPNISHVWTTKRCKKNDTFGQCFGKHFNSSKSVLIPLVTHQTADIRIRCSAHRCLPVEFSVSSRKHGKTTKPRTFRKITTGVGIDVPMFHITQLLGM